MNKFYTWATLIAATAYLIFLGYFYSIHSKPISDFTHKDLLQVLGALFAIVAVFRVSSWLRADYGQAESPHRLHADSAETLPTHNVSAKPPLSFGAAMRKRPGTLAALFLFAISLPPLIRLGKQGASGTIFSREYWHSVIIGELLMAVCVTAGWFVAKRKYEKHLRR
jgi:protein-S-isoprenylcysteine O-methyltransferase Ste14